LSCITNIVAIFEIQGRKSKGIFIFSLLEESSLDIYKMDTCAVDIILSASNINKLLSFSFYLVGCLSFLTLMLIFGKAKSNELHHFGRGCNLARTMGNKC